MGISQQIGASSLIKPGVCTSTTRPASPYEGQMVYEKDTDMIAIWNGTAWRYIAAATPTNGTVLQVVSTTAASTVTLSNTTYVSSGLSTSITPKSTSSKVLILVNLAGMYKSTDAAGNGINIQLWKNGSSIVQLEADFLRTDDTQRQHGQYHGFYFDSPATISSTTYAIYCNNRTTGTCQIMFNAASPSSLILQEIAG